MIEIKFAKEFHQQLLTGEKTATTRRGMKGNTGDIFKVSHKNIGDCPLECINAEYQMMGSCEMPFSVIMELFWDIEGFNGEQEFVDAWMKFYPDSDVWNEVVFHRFRRYYRPPTAVEDELL